MGDPSKRPRGTCPVCFRDVAVRMTGECTKHGHKPQRDGVRKSAPCAGTGQRGLQGVEVRDCRKKCGNRVCYPKNDTVGGIGICDTCLDSVSR